MIAEDDAAWWQGAVIYQIYPLSFRDGNGDGWGDLPGLAEGLDYVASLGVDAIWLSPFYRSPLADFGYDVADHAAVDPLFGTLADADRVIRRAHELGLKVLIDQVWSHTSDRHAWFEESRGARAGAKADWYVWADPAPDGGPPNNWLSVFGGPAWRWEPRRRQYYLHHFLPCQPKLNLRHPAALAAVLDIGAFWLDRGVDGFRLDAVDFLLHDPALRSNPAAPPPDGVVPLKPFALQRHDHDMLQAEVLGLLRRIRALTDRHGAVTLAEVSSQPGAFDRIADYTGEGGLHLAYTLRQLKGELGAPLVAAALGEGRAAIGRNGLCWATGNHDVERLASRWQPAGADSQALRRLLTALLCALPGALCLYQGDELGLPEPVLERADLRDPFGLAYWPEYRGRDGARTPLPWRRDLAHAGFTTAARPWLPVPAEHRALAIDGQQRDPASSLAQWRDFLAWRHTRPALRRGSLAGVDGAGPLLRFERRLGAERIFCAFNLGNEPAGLAVPPGLVPLPAPGAAGSFAAGRLALPGWAAWFGALDPAAAPR